MACNCGKKKKALAAMGLTPPARTRTRVRGVVTPPPASVGKVSWVAVPPAGAEEFPVPIFTIGERDRWVSEHPGWTIESVSTP